MQIVQVTGISKYIALLKMLKLPT